MMVVRGIQKRLDEAIDSLIGRDTTPLRDQIRGWEDRKEILKTIHLVESAQQAVHTEPAAQTKAAHLTKLMDAARQSTQSAESTFQRFRQKFWRPAVAFAAVLALSLPTAALASNAQPGELLYGAKLGIESLQLGLELDPAGDVALHLEFAGRRLGEVAALIAQGREDEVDAVLSNAESHRSSAGRGVDRLVERKDTEETIEERYSPVISEQVVQLTELAEESMCNPQDPSAGDPRCKGLLNALESSEKLLDKVNKGNKQSSPGKSNGVGNRPNGEPSGPPAQPGKSGDN